MGAFRFELVRCIGQPWGTMQYPGEIIANMSFDVIEDGTPCDYCGQPVGFLEDDWTVCPTCRAEYINMDFEGGDLETDSPLEF